MGNGCWRQCGLRTRLSFARVALCLASLGADLTAPDGTIQVAKACSSSPACLPGLRRHQFDFTWFLSLQFLKPVVKVNSSVPRRSCCRYRFIGRVSEYAPWEVASAGHRIRSLTLQLRL